MAEIDFGETQDEHNAVVENFIRQIKGDFYGNGREGILSRMTKFLDTFEAVEKERESHQDKRHRENAEKMDNVSQQIGKKTLWWTAAGVSIALAGVLVSILAILVMIRLAKAADVRDLLRGDRDSPVLSSTQNTSMPPTYVPGDSQ
jgi:hypothetical protein